jgi:hypothetical protein
MFSHISQILAEERARDLHSAAAGAQLRREARRARRARRSGDLAPAASGTAPDSYEDFLCQTAQSVMREPTAAGRSQGQAVR